jgi:hypothetical protein
MSHATAPDAAQPLVPLVPLVLGALAERPTVSVAIASYNYARFLVECLDSCRGQTLPVDEVVLVDDGSTDDTQAVLAAYAAQHPALNLRVVRQENAGVSAATNTAIAACTGDVVLLLDADDVMLAERAEKVVAAFREPVQGHLPGLVHHRIQRFSDTHADLGTTPLYENGAPLGFLADEVIDTGESPVSTSSSGLAFRREVLAAIGPLEAHRIVAQDMQLWMAGPLLTPIAWIPEALSRYRMHNQSDSSGGMLSSLPKVQVMIDRHERLATWTRGLVQKHHPQAAHRWQPVTAQPSYQWMKFLERWWSGAGKDFGLLFRFLKHPETRGASLQQRLYMYSSIVLPRRPFMALSRLLFGASPAKQMVRRLLGRT